MSHIVLLDARVEGRPVGLRDSAAPGPAAQDTVSSPSCVRANAAGTDPAPEAGVAVVEKQSFCPTLSFAFESAAGHIRHSSFPLVSRFIQK